MQTQVIIRLQIYQISVPTSGAISLNDFYGKERAFKKTYSSTATNQSGVGVFGDDFAVDYPKQIVVNSSITVGATSTANPKT